MTLTAYAPALTAGFIWDDDAYVTENPTLRTPAGLIHIWTNPSATPQYYPLVFTSFWAEYHLWGLNPFGYHLVNILLHALSAVLLWRLLLVLGISAPWLAAAVFALHPVQVESVAWVTERKNVLSGVFYLAAALAYLQFWPIGVQSSIKHRWGWYLLSLVLFACALLGKTVACSLPAALLVVVWWKTGEVRLGRVLSLLPMFLLGAALAAVTVWVEHTHVGARGVDWELSATQRCLIAGRAVWFYLGKLCIPIGLTFIYPRWEVDSASVWQYLFPLGVLALFLVLWLGRRKWGRGPLAAALFFAGTLVPALGFIDTYPMRFSFVADHFQYLASVGAIVLLVEVGAELSRRYFPKESPIPVAAAIVILVTLGLITFTRCFAYESLETIWTDTLAQNEGAWIAHNNLGEVLLAKGKTAEALEHYRTAARLKPDDASFRYNSGKAEWFLGNVDSSIREFREAIRLDPDYATAHFNLGVSLCRKGLLDEGLHHLETAVRLKPDLVEAQTNLGSALAQASRYEEAIPHFIRATELTPGDANAYYNLALTFARLGQFPTALLYAEKAAELRPSDPMFRDLCQSLRRETGKQ